MNLAGCCVRMCQNDDFGKSSFETIVEGRNDIPNNKLNPHTPASCSLTVACSILANPRVYYLGATGAFIEGPLPLLLLKRNWISADCSLR